MRGLVSRITSGDSPTVGAGSTVNEVRFTYNDFGQSIKTYQAHAGAVDVLTTPSVQTGYAGGSANTIRPTSLRYPNGRVLTYDYGVATSINQHAGRIASLVDSDVGETHLADYGYLGLATVAVQSIPQPGIEFTLLGSLPPEGNSYAALDRFGRMRQSLWKQGGTALSDVRYGYDRAGNRTWRSNPLATAHGAQYDWLYEYDGLQRLKTGGRGTLNASATGLSSQTFAQCWSLDETGNWSGFKQSDHGATWSLEQTRTANPVNELTAINATVGDQWATAKYDANGNMTAIPRPGLDRPSWANLTTDQWAALTVNDWARMEVVPTFQATYDAWNRLVKLTEPGATTADPVQENQYDGRGYRIVTKTYTAGTLAETRHAYFTDQWQCVEERLGTSTTPDRQFVWDVRYIDDLILRDRSVSGGTLNERLYALQDANWNVTAAADSTGMVQERFEYDPYGVATVMSPTFDGRSTSAYDWETTYAGYRWDAASGLFAVRHRYYHPKLGTWFTRDPLGQVDGPNLYLLPHSLTATDPLGLRIWICVRQFDGKNDEEREAYKKKFLDKSYCNNLPKIAHVYIRIQSQGQENPGTISFHPSTWPTGGIDANKRRPGRLWFNDPADTDWNGFSTTPLAGQCFLVVPDDSYDQRLKEEIVRWAIDTGVGRDRGEHMRVGGTDQTIGAEGHKDPSPSCSVMYNVANQNCGWWAAMMLRNAGVPVPKDVELKCKQWNAGTGPAKTEGQKLHEGLYEGRAD